MSQQTQTSVQTFQKATNKSKLNKLIHGSASRWLHIQTRRLNHTQYKGDGIRLQCLVFNGVFTPADTVHNQNTEVTNLKALNKAKKQILHSDIFFIFTTKTLICEKMSIIINIYSEEPLMYIA